MSRLVIFLVFGGLIGCGTDKTVAVRNTDPEAWITSHSDNAEIFVGISTLFFGSASDTNHQEIDLLTNWYVDNRELCMNVTPQVDGTTSCEIALEEGDEVLRLQVVDPLGATSFNEIRLDIIPFMVPEISWFSPIEEDAYYTDTPISFRAEVVDDQDTPDALDIVWSSSQDGVLDIASPDAEGKIEDFAFLAEGNHILSVEVTNSGGKSVEHSETVTVRAPNQPPTCGISFPSSGSSVLQGTLLTLQAQVADPDIDASYLQTSWTSDQDGLLGVGVFDNGVLMLTTNTLSPAFHSISLVAEDELGLRCTDSIQLFVGSPPTVSISTPIAAQVFTLGEVISFEGQVGDAEESSTQLDVRWSSDVDGEFAQETPTSTGMITTSFDALSAGPQQITLSATDSAGFSGSDDVAIYINTAPEQPEILLEPIAPTSVEDLTVSVVSSGDVDGDTLSFLYLWYRDNVATGNTASTLSSSETAVGETWRVEVSAFDGYTEGIVAMAEVEIINTAPDITVPVISPSTAFNDNVLTCAATATDLDQSVSVSYAWNVLSQTFTGSTLDLGSLGIMPTTEIVCIAQTIDDQLAVDTESSNLFLGNRAPLLSSHAIIPNFAYVGGDLECDAIFVDPDGETLSISYEWTSNSGVLGASQTLVLQEGDAEAGDVITCTAVVEDGYGEVVSSSAFAIVQSAPIFDVAASITPSGSVYTGTEVVCSAIATDAEDGSVPVSFSWSVGSTVVATGATYIVDSDDVAVGGVLTCTATATDMDLNESISIVDVVIENTVPQINGIQISPSSLYNDETAICSATVVDVDEVIAPSYAWSIGGQSVGTGDSLSLNSTFVLPFDTLTCTVEAIDSEGSVVEGTESIVISNRPPTEPEIVISPTLPDVGVDDLVCTMTTSSTDADGDSITYTYSW
jgi:hypothetical protein